MFKIVCNSKEFQVKSIGNKGFEGWMDGYQITDSEGRVVLYLLSSITLVGRGTFCPSDTDG